MSSSLVYALIPARGGSKRLPGKNIRMLNGKPLIAYSIESAFKCKSISRVICSTDSLEIAEVARKYGAEVLMRPDEFAADTSPDIDVFNHCLRWLGDSKPELMVQLRPTSPLRKTSEIELAINLLLENPSFDCVRGVSISNASPFLMWTKNKNNLLEPVVREDLVRFSSMRKQDHPDVYIHNGVLDVIRTSVIQEKHSMCGTNIYPLVTSNDFDIDTLEDFERVEAYLKKGELYE